MNSRNLLKEARLWLIGIPIALWTLIPITFALILVQEMSARMGVVTGKGLSDLIRERFGVKSTFFVMLALVIANDNQRIELGFCDVVFKSLHRLDDNGVTFADGFGRYLRCIPVRRDFQQIGK